MNYFCILNASSRLLRFTMSIALGYILSNSYVFTIIILLQPIHYLNGLDTSLIEEQIIVKYKSPCLSPLDKNYINEQITRTQYSQNQNEHSIICPKRTDLVLIKSKNSEALIEELNNNPDIEYAVPNIIKKTCSVSAERNDKPNDPLFSTQWALENKIYTAKGTDIDFLNAMSLSRKEGPEEPVIIAIIDTSFAINNLDLANQVWINEEEIPNNGIDDDNNGYVDDIHGYHFANNNSNVMGIDNHGSHVAGIILAESNNSKGISGAFSKIKFIALACETTGGLALDAIISAKNYIINLKNRGYNIVAVNASYGGPIASEAEFDAIEELSNNGIIFCNASGNDGFNLEVEKDLNHDGIINPGEDINADGYLDVSYPTSYPLANIISVAAINQDGDMAAYSNFGKSEVDIAAPGSNINSTIDVPNSQYSSQTIEFSSEISANGISGDLINCGLGYPENFPISVVGNIALIERGEITFSEKVVNAISAGAVAAVIYNNGPEESNGLRLWTLGAEITLDPIPSLSISQIDGLNIKNQLPTTALIQSTPLELIVYNHEDSYKFDTGTSMACPLVTAAVAFAAYNFPNETITQRRNRIINNTVYVPNLSNKTASGGVLNLLKIVDTDEDNLPDWWEIDHFNNLLNTGTQDTDNDGYTNREEFISGTNPMVTDDKPSFKTNISLYNLTYENSDSLSFEFMTHPGYIYTIQNMDSFLDNTWNDTAQNNISGDGIPIKVTVDNLSLDTKVKEFYRLKATPE